MMRIIKKKPEPEPEKPEEPAPKLIEAIEHRRTSLPEPDLHAALSAIYRDQKHLYDDHGYLSRTKHEWAAGRRMEDSARIALDDAICIIAPHRLELARRARRRQRAIEYLHGFDYYREARKIVSELLSAAMFGKRVQGVSIDNGEGFEDLLSGGTLEP